MLVYYKAIAAILIFLVSFAIAFYPLKKKHAPEQHSETAELGEALASGIFLGAAFFHMLPDSLRMFNHLYGSLNLPIPEIICVLGFLLLLFLERLSLRNHTTHTNHAIPYVLALILVIHAITEGAALGLGATLSETLMLLIAILAHKGSETFALCVTLMRHAIPFNRVTWIIIFFALMTPLGIAMGAAVNEFSMVHNGELLAAVFNAFAAGTFLYISTLHHIHFHKHTQDTQSMLEFLSLVAGTAIMGLISLWA